MNEKQTQAQPAAIPVRYVRESIERRVLLITVQDQPGVLARVVGVFAGRGWNIADLTVARVTSAKYEDQKDGVSRITIIVETTNEQAEQMTNQLSRLIPVLEVEDLTTDPDKVEADVSLVKVLTDNPRLQTEIAHMAQVQYRAMSVRTRNDFIVLRFVGQEKAAKDFVAAIKHFGVNVETAHSGIVAIA